MHGNVPAGAGSAIEVTPDCESETKSPLASEKPPDDWFFDAAQAVLGKDAGGILNVLTGYPLSSCYAYVTTDRFKRRKPPGHFLRTLIHSNQGEPFFDAFMAGCTARWWLDLQRHQRNGERLDTIELE